MIGGGAYHASDKVVQHNGCGTVNIINFYVNDYGKLYRSCGNVSISLYTSGIDELLICMHSAPRSASAMFTLRASPRSKAASSLVSTPIMVILLHSRTSALMRRSSARCIMDALVAVSRRSLALVLAKLA